MFRVQGYLSSFATSLLHVLLKGQRQPAETEEQLKPAVRIQFLENLDDGDVNFYRIRPSGTGILSTIPQSLSASLW